MLVKLGPRGTLTIPKELRAGLTTGTPIEAIRRDDGVIELRPRVLVDAAQAWFWTERWQRMEREADDDVRAGRIARFADLENFLADLDAVPLPPSRASE